MTPTIYVLTTEGIDEAAQAAWLASAAAHLDAAERARLERYIPLEKRLEFLLGRVLVKSVLERDFGVARPAILTEPEGSKPRLASEGDSAGRLPSWNLSHSKGALALIVGPPGADVGVDIERIRDARRELVDYVTREEERAQVVDAETFTRLWTAKEAYMKLVGSGLAIGPTRLRVDLALRTVTDCDRGETRPFAWERRGAWVLSWMAEAEAKT